ncbi:helix-turn-helix domain-containing protein [Aequorivita echinoideorum]|uniref:AraC family transcriptional regulator n=1 Tax=Aequorivita echinoideorum TaxID=1549647 RepID=A0ABS5S4Z7_9FLAO|nr:AraC family transcriptional regulator [Aequorivita echinoideorum]MBT0608281.1 AraC family transcriptional regulator [Aequorivita echinoideorum]
MQIYKVTSLPLDEVIRDIANEFETDYYKEKGEYILNVPHNIGSGTIKGVNFDGGLGIIQYNCAFKDETEIRFTVNEVHPLKFIYLLEGELYHRFANKNTPHKLNRFQNAIVASEDKNGHILRFKKETPTSIFSLEIDRKKFQRNNSFDKDDMNISLKKLFEDVEAETSFYYEGDYSLRMTDLFKTVEDHRDCTFINLINMESVAYQTLVQQLSQYLDDLNDCNQRHILRRKEMEQIKIAADYVKDNIATYKAMPELIKLTGLNPLKLQQGFKDLYNKTVHQYVFDTRLDLAKDLLVNTDQSISEIIFKVGLTSKSYFSKIFKEEYGVQPSNFRAKNKRNN